MTQRDCREEEFFSMNTITSFLINGDRSEVALRIVKAELFAMERRLSRFEENSEISKVNKSAGSQLVEVSAETYGILDSAVYMSEISEGSFDVTISPLVDLWNKDRTGRLPEKNRIKGVQGLVNFRDLIFDSGEKKIGLRNTGQAIDLGGIGKGYASDHCVEILRSYGVKSAYINIGGNVSTLGKKQDGSLWRVGIRHPRKEKALIGAVEIEGKAVVTSGDYERYFFDTNGIRRHHILNPFTGYPADSGLISVSVIHDNAMIGDALSTAIFTSGKEKGTEYLKLFPGAEAIMIDTHQRVHITRGLMNSFQCTEGVKFL